MPTKQEDPSQRAATEAQVAGRHGRAFSLVELLIVIAIIAILIALIIVGLQRVSASAARAESANALRQMIAGYLSYSGDNNNRLMPGYVDYTDGNPSTKAPLLNAKLASGEWMVEVNAKFDDRENLNSYVWRLSPYLGHSWQTVMSDYRDRGAIAYFNSQFDQEIYGMGEEPGVATIASAPSYGLNSIFFGGDDRHGGNDILGKAPWLQPDMKIAATRTSEVVNSRAIVFAPTGAGDPGWSKPGDDAYLGGAGINGYPELRPPFLTQDDGVWQQMQWQLGIGGRLEPTNDTEFAKGVGLPITRHRGGMIPVARFDGSAEVVNLGDIAVDMRHWSPFQTGTVVPPADVP